MIKFDSTWDDCSCSGGNNWRITMKKEDQLLWFNLDEHQEDEDEDDVNLCPFLLRTTLLS